MIKIDKNADPRANATVPAPPMNDLICDNTEAQISEKVESN